MKKISILLAILLLLPVVSALPMLPAYQCLIPNTDFYQYNQDRLDQLMLEVKSNNLPSSYVGTRASANGQNLTYMLTGTLTPLGPNNSRFLIVSRQHGDEAASSFFLEGFLENLTQEDPAFKNNRLYIFPNANPWGSINDTRLNAQGFDINRGWNNLSGAAESETMRQTMLGAYDKYLTYVIDIHALASGEVESYSFAAGPNATAMCQAVNQELNMTCLERNCTQMPSGSALSYYCNRGKPTLLIELFQNGTTPQAVYQQGTNFGKLLERLRTIN